VSVRRAHADESLGVVRAHEAAWDSAIAPLVGTTLGRLAPLEARVERARATLADPPENACAWVYEREGAIVGTAVAVDVELRDLYVVPAAWGTGVAGALMQAALGWIASRGADDAVLWVGEANLRARRFYEREGWAADGETRASPLGPLEVRYRRAL
jgi:GNAT superfamily N-acetyltransferase